MSLTLFPAQATPRHRFTGVVNGQRGLLSPIKSIFSHGCLKVLGSIPLIEIADVVFEVYDCSPFIHSKQTNKQKNKQILSEKIQYSSALVVQTHVHLKSINAILHLVMLLLSRYVNRRATIQLYTERVDVIFSRHAKIMSKTKYQSQFICILSIILYSKPSSKRYMYIGGSGSVKVTVRGIWHL